ncbi:hypothetical protein [Leptothoe spongobia]|uniref:SCP2 domain-containing protein n=1 Tax=Leptothoe spongobia TAU-MAC 1115 TaxID=1967444 RepID=A0A947GMA7_9CYAN|nr:hypothetical protein [Leptothoe spongobia]MBT9315416.1 hypothetical protein [Leptothoe spongobia TAU-MAC 1115]
MKPWQVATDVKELRNNLNKNQRKYLDQEEELSSDERIEGINTLFRLAEDYWKTVGVQNPFVIQFYIEDMQSESWFVKVDDTGGEAIKGLYAGKPTMTWSSDFDTLEGTFKGSVPDRNSLTIDGDFNTLKILFTALHQSSPYS